MTWGEQRRPGIEIPPHPCAIAPGTGQGGSPQFLHEEKAQSSIAARPDGILPLLNREVSHDVRQLNRKDAKPGILLDQRRSAVDSLTWRFIVRKGRGLFKQWRQNVEKFLALMSQGYDVAGAGAAVFLVARRMFDAHGKSLYSGGTPCRIRTVSIESLADLSPKWDRLDHAAQLS
jgi:hypothetical protein